LPSGIIFGSARGGKNDFPAGDFIIYPYAIDELNSTRIARINRIYHLSY
jgi:hypothetical protein